MDPTVRFHAISSFEHVMSITLTITSYPRSVSQAWATQISRLSAKHGGRSCKVNKVVLPVEKAAHKTTSESMSTVLQHTQSLTFAATDPLL